MLTEEQKKKITEFAEKSVAGNDELHQMTHVSGVAEDALMLAKKEHGDPEVCWTAAMLHDVVKSKPGDHGTEGSKIAERFLLELGLNKDFVEKVRDTIYWHNKPFSDGPIERAILWDADKYQMIGIKGFEDRIKICYINKPDIKPERIIEDYYFYATRFHTKTGRAEVKKHEKVIEEHFAKLKAENSS